MMERLLSYFRDRREKSDTITVERRKPEPNNVERRLHDAIDTFSKTIVRHRDNLP